EAAWTAAPAGAGWRLTAAARAWIESLTLQTDPAALSARCLAPGLGRRSLEARQLVAARHSVPGWVAGPAPIYWRANTVDRSIPATDDPCPGATAAADRQWAELHWPRSNWRSTRKFC